MNLFTVLGNLSLIRAAWDAGEQLVADGKITAKDFFAFKDAVFKLIDGLWAPVAQPPSESTFPQPTADDLNRQELDLLKKWAPWYVPNQDDGA